MTARSNISPPMAASNRHRPAWRDSARRSVPMSVAGWRWPSGSNRAERQLSQSSKQARLMMKLIIPTNSLNRATI